MGSSTWAGPDLGGSYVGLGDDRPRGPAELKPGLDAGLAVVRYTYDVFRVDRLWSVVEERGFTWWGHRLATRVWTEPGYDDDGIEIFRLVARTALLSDVPDSQLVTTMLDAGNGMAITSALLPDPETRSIDYVASQWVHTDTLGWVAKLFSTVVAMQAAEAHQRAEPLAQLLGATPAFAGHPGSGERVDPDDMLGILQLITQRGQLASTWAGPDMSGALEWFRRLPVVARAVGDEATIILELDDARHTALVQVSARAPHPALGNGLLVRSSIEPIADIDGAWAATMNRLELEVINPAMFLGSWVAASDRPTFVTFYPNFIADSGVGVTDVVLSAVNRAMWAARIRAAA